MYQVCTCEESRTALCPIHDPLPEATTTVSSTGYIKWIYPDSYTSDKIKDVPCMFEGLDPNKAYGIACPCPKHSVMFNPQQYV